jgi:hypothetical protein
MLLERSLLSGYNGWSPEFTGSIIDYPYCTHCSRIEAPKTPIIMEEHSSLEDLSICPDALGFPIKS